MLYNSHYKRCRRWELHELVMQSYIGKMLFSFIVLVSQANVFKIQTTRHWGAVSLSKLSFESNLVLDYFVEARLIREPPLWFVGRGLTGRIAFFTLKHYFSLYYIA